jgi:hypothetical protein
VYTDRRCFHGVCFFNAFRCIQRLWQRLKRQIISPTRVAAAMPPTTPPAIATTLLCR